MNAIMISVSRSEFRLISHERKTAVISRRRPSMFEVPFKMYFYEKLGNLKNIQKVGYTEYRHEGRGRVVGECICHAVKSVDMNQMDFALETALQMKTRDISKLLDG